MSSLAGSSGGSFLDPLVLFDVAVLGVPAAFDPATSVSPDAAALLRADTKGFDFSEEHILYDRYAELKLLQEPCPDQGASSSNSTSSNSSSSSGGGGTSSGEAMAEGVSRGSVQGGDAEALPAHTSKPTAGATTTSTTTSTTSTTTGGGGGSASAASSNVAQQQPPPAYWSPTPAAAAGAAGGPGVERVQPSASTAVSSYARGTVLGMQTPPALPASSVGAGASSGGLTERQKVALMKDTVGEGEDSVCEFYLESMQWDLEGAIAMYQAMKG